MAGSDFGDTRETILGGRYQWNMIQFSFLCSYTLGWRALSYFPALVYHHTCLFLVAYYALMLLVCVPITFIQLKLGGTNKCGIVSLFKHHIPALKGVGICIIVLMFIQCVVQSIPISYSLYYMCTAFKHQFIWQGGNDTYRHSEKSLLYLTSNPVEKFFYNEFLQTSVSILNPGMIPWYLGVALFATWLVIFIYVIRGASWLGKVIYVAFPAALVCLFTVLIYSHSILPSSFESLSNIFQGTHKFIDSSKEINDKASNITSSPLFSPVTWVGALKQHIYSLCLWMGVLPVLGTHLTTKKPASNVSWVVLLLIHSILPHLSTIAIAPFIHSLAQQKGLPFTVFINSGSHFLYINLPEAFSITKTSPYIVFMFYAMVFLFTIIQQVCMMLVLCESIVELSPKYSRIIFKRQELLVAVLCFVGFILGLPQICQGGIDINELLDDSVYRAAPILILCMILPCVAAYCKYSTFHFSFERLSMSIWFIIASFIAASFLMHDEYLRLQTKETLSVNSQTESVTSVIIFAPLIICVVLGFIHEVFTSQEDTVKKRLKSVCHINFIPLATQEGDFNDPYFDDKPADSSTLKFRRDLAKQAARECAAQAKDHVIQGEASGITANGEVLMADMEVCINSNESAPPASL